jgi:hypothetical protein
MTVAFWTERLGLPSSPMTVNGFHPFMTVSQASATSVGLLRFARFDNGSSAQSTIRLRASLAKATVTNAGDFLPSGSFATSISMSPAGASESPYSMNEMLVR